jgi:hypothetical protein
LRAIEQAHRIDHSHDTGGAILGAPFARFVRFSRRNTIAGRLEAKPS